MPTETGRLHRLVFALALLAAACSSHGTSGGGTGLHLVGGTISGLAGSGLVLATPGQANLAVAVGTTAFSFATAVPDGTAYDVGVAAQPAGPAQTCTVSRGIGTVSGADVSDVAVTCQTTVGTPAAVAEHHNGPDRRGVFKDPAWTKAAAAGVHRDTAFSATVSGHVYAQPLFLPDGPGGKDVLLVATESNEVSAIDVATGQAAWRVSLGAPVPLSHLPCGNIDPLGVTGTPVIDLAARTLYLDAMTTADGGATRRHRIFALSLDDGSVRAGWPVEVEGLTSGTSTFNSSVQNQRGALALVGVRLYVPYGGHYGDCGDYHGWLVGIDVADTSHVTAWATPARGGGAWGPSGVASDGSSLFIATGNTFGASSWGGGEAVLRFSSGPVFGGAATDYFAPADWLSLDNGDVDIGGSAPVLLEVPGATPSALAVALGKNGVAYLLDRANLGGIGHQLSSLHVSTDEIINAAAAYRAAAGTVIAFKGAGIGCPSGQGGDLTALLVHAAAPPTVGVRWCGSSGGLGSPMVTTTDGTAEPVVWVAGAEGDERLHGFDGDSGAVLFDGGGAGSAMGTVRRYVTPILAKGRIFVAGDGAVYAFTR